MLFSPRPPFSRQFSPLCQKFLEGSGISLGLLQVDFSPLAIYNVHHSKGAGYTSSALFFFSTWWNRPEKKLLNLSL